MPNDQPSVERTTIWDPLVRGFHWLLVGSVSVALWTGFFGGMPATLVHVVSGCTVAALLIVRVVWGFTGTKHARFRDFMTSPFRIARYIRQLLRGRAPAHAGHNPLGGLMILGLLLMLAAILVSGVVALGGVAKDGPLAAVVSYAKGSTVAALHRALSFGLIGMVVLHVTGVLLESWRTGENLIRAMITGRKRHATSAVEGEATGNVAARPYATLGLTAGLAAIAIPAIIAASRLPVPGVPSAALDPVYAKECGSCHSLHHPSLAPAATWNAMMAGLAGHFGETATLGAETEGRIAHLLATNAAERWDTAAANRLRTPSPGEPLRITATTGWKEIHRAIAETVFSAKSVGGKVNCGNCHADAETGVFSRRSINIPRE